MTDEVITFPDERAYMYNDPDLSIQKTDPKEVHRPRWRNRYKKCIQLAENHDGRWLDVACGSGYGTELISQVADYVLGVDIDSKTICYARKHHGSKSNIEFANKDIMCLSELEEGKGKYDIVISVETIEHIPDAKPFLKKVSQLLTSNGTFVVTTPESQVGGGKNPHNKFHCNEYTYLQFSNILKSIFNEVHITTEKAFFSTGLETVQMYAVCKSRK